MIDSGHEDAAMPYDPPDETDTDREDALVVDVKNRHEQRLLAIDGVKGVGIGSTEIGDDAIILYLRDSSVRERIPSEIEGIPIRPEITGEIDAL